MSESTDATAAMERQSAFLWGLVATVLATVVVKLLTGMALAPLTVIAVVVFVLTVSMRLRLLRTGHD